MLSELALTFSFEDWLYLHHRQARGERERVREREGGGGGRGRERERDKNTHSQLNQWRENYRYSMKTSSYSTL